MYINFKQKTIIASSIILMIGSSLANAGDTNQVDVPVVNEATAALEPYDFSDQEEVAVATPQSVSATPADASAMFEHGFFLQLGAFQSEENSDKLSNKIKAFKRENGVEIFKLYDNGIYRLNLGPYATRDAADVAATQISQEYSIKAMVKDRL